MDLKDIQELIKFVAKSGATEVDLEIDNIKISIKSPAKKKRGEIDEISTILQTPTIPIVAPTSAPAVVTNSSENTPVVNENDNFITIKSSMIGTFYRSSSPENPPFINIGDIIKEGDTLCIIEAMKLFNEIESEVSGKIVKVLVDDTTPIEFDQPLFLVDPS
jgi:acetyl-CoA carboxylase biotin carboxyl carrier protein